MSCFDGIWHSDTLVPTSLRTELIDAARLLEDIPEEKKDWHPNSDDQVLDLVHPSLYPVVYGRTLGHYPDPDGPVAPITCPFPQKGRFYEFRYRSDKFQWLPTDFEVDDTGQVKALGYINNLHTSHEGLYRCIEGVIKCFIPLWERVLIDLFEDLPTRIPDSYQHVRDIDPRFPREDTKEVVEEKSKAKDDGNEEGGEGLDYWDRVDDYYDNVWEIDRIVYLPDVPEDGYPGGIEDRAVNISLHGKMLQVIVKLANIHLVHIALLRVCCALLTSENLP